ncbi:MAG: NfeD family protein [Cyclobacteriaceae bacterium]
MTWIVLLSLLFFGALLVMLEIIFVPGTTVVGLLGLIFSGLGVFYAFLNFEAGMAYFILAVTIMINIGLLVYGLKSGVWDRFSLKQTITNRTYDDRILGLEKGQKGVAISDCKPYGKIEVGDKIYEAKSLGGFIEAGTPILIDKVEYNKIIIKK